MTDPAAPRSANPRNSYLLAAVVFTAVGLLALALYLMPWVTKDIDMGYSEAATRNPYLAAERFLEALNIEVSKETGLSSLDQLPSVEDTLLIANSRRHLSERRLDNLTGWVKRGGGVIVVATDFYDEDEASSGDQLLDDLGIWLLPSEYEGSGKARVNPAEECAVDDRLTAIQFEGKQQPLQVQLTNHSYLYFDDQPSYISASNAAGIQMVYAPLGQGYVYVLTSLTHWRNRNIACFDNAHLLRSLADEDRTLWWLANTEIEPIYALIWQHWPIAVCLAFLWLAMWLWRGAYRHARIEHEEVAPRREVLEHITGMARFLHQQGELDALLSGLRRQCVPGDPHDDGLQTRYAQHIEQWALQLNKNPALIRWALFGKVSKDPNDLSKAVTLLQKIKKLAER